MITKQKYLEKMMENIKCSNCKHLYDFGTSWYCFFVESDISDPDRDVTGCEYHEEIEDE